MNGVGALHTSIQTGYTIWPKGDMGLHTCRVYKTLQEASDTAQESADLHHRPYEVRAAYESPVRTIKTIKPRKRK